jgi:hypothetical protein
MIGIPTGRSRTVAISGSFSGSSTGSATEGLSGYNTNCSIFVGIWVDGSNQELPGGPRFLIESAYPFYGSGWNTMGTTVYWEASLGDFTIDSGDADSGTFSFGSETEPWTLDLSGTFTATFEVEERLLVTSVDTIVDPGTELEDGYPKWGGDTTFRGSPATAVEYLEVITDGATVTFALDFASVRVSFTATYSGAEKRFYRDHVLRVSCEGFAGIDSNVPSAICSVSMSEDGVTTGTNWEHTYTADGISNSANTDLGAYVSMSGNGPGSVIDGGGYNRADCYRTYEMPTTYRWNAKAFAYDTEMIQPLTWEFHDQLGTTTTQAFTGSFTRDVEQLRESVFVFFGPFSDQYDFATRDVQTKTFCNARVVPSSLTAIGEDPKNWRPFIHGKGYPVFTVSQDETLEITGTSTSGWTGGTNTTVSTGLTLTTNSSGTGSATRAWSGDGLNVEGYRWLKVRIRSVGSANQPVTLAIGSKTWSLTTSSDGTWVERFVDLCCPGNSSWTTDDESSRYLITHDTRVPVAESPDSWGVKRITSLSLTGLPVSSTIEVSKIEQIRRAGAHASFIPFFEPKTLRWTSPTDDTFGWTGVYLNTDGRNNDLPDQYHVVPFVGDPYYVHYTIAQMMTLFEEISGWNTTISGSFPDDFHDEDLFGYFLEGAGYYATYSGSSVTWATRGHYSIASATINAQPLWDWVKVYPGAGDVWSGSAVGATPLAVHWSGRGRATGIVFDIDKSPKSGAVVSTDPSSGSGTTDSFGQYLTSTPFFKHDVSTDVKVGSQEITTVLESGQTGRFCFIVESNGTSVWAHNLLSVFGFAHWVWATDDGVKHRRSNTSWPLVVDVNSVVSSDGSDACPVLRQNSDGRLFCLFVRGALGSRELFECYSDDDGATWTTPEEIGLAEYCYTFTDSFGYEGRAKFVFASGDSGPGSISIQTRGPGETAFGSWVTVAVGGSPVLFAEGSFGIVAAEDSAGHWILTAVNDGGSEPTNYASTDEAKTWKLA